MKKFTTKHTNVICAVKCFLLKAILKSIRNRIMKILEASNVKFVARNSIKNVKTHQKTHIKNRPKPFKCHRCDYATDMQTSFNRHQKSHEHQDKKFAAMKNPLKCEKCAMFCKDKVALYDHMRHVHPKVLFQCDMCAKHIKVKCNLIKHIKLHIFKSTKQFKVCIFEISNFKKPLEFFLLNF